MSRRLQDTPPLHDTPLAKAASQAGGVLVSVDLKPLALGPNGGCGAPTHVAGTNGGTMPCGAFLTRFGKREPYYCGACEESMKAAVAA